MEVNFVYVTLELLKGFGKTAELFAATLLFAIPLGLVFSFFSMSKFKPLKMIMKTFIWIIRGTPLMLQLIIVYYGPGLIFGLDLMDRFNAALIAFVINYACYFSEIYRGGIESIPKGQYEAGQVLGMTKTQIFFRVILLQVIKRIIAPISNEIITLVKDTSLSFVIAIPEMFTVAKQIAAAEASISALLIAGGFYYVFNAIVAVVMERFEKRLDYYDT